MVSSTERFFSTVSCVRQNFERLKRCNAQLARYDLLTSKEQVDETLEHSSFICSSVSAQISDLKAILKACSRDDLRACARHFELVTQQFSEINRSRLNIIHNLDQEEARSQKRITNFEDENRTGEALQDESIQKSEQTCSVAQRIRGTTNEVERIESDLNQLLELFHLFEDQVIAQEPVVMDIEYTSQRVVDNVSRGNELLDNGIKKGKDARRKMWWLIILAVVVVTVIVAVVVVVVLVVGERVGK